VRYPLEVAGGRTSAGEGGEIIVTRDAKPVARILPYEAPSRAARVRFDPAEQKRWLTRFWRNRAPGPSTDELLRRDREA
jgi:antitoxin (DNA-binding transcriptional repressor) of toxin-antitoxin stability system